MCRVKDMRCGTALHAVWPRSCHRSCSELSAWLTSNYSSLPKVTRFHRTIVCKTVTHIGTEIHLSTFITPNWIILLNYGVLTLQLLHGFKIESRWRKWNLSLFCQVEKEESLPSRVSLSWHISTVNILLQTFCHLYNISFLLLKFVRLFLMEYILKCL